MADFYLDWCATPSQTQAQVCLDASPSYYQLMNYWRYWTVDWGDGSPPETFFFDPNLEAFPPPCHVYQTTDPVTLTISTATNPDHPQPNPGVSASTPVHPSINQFNEYCDLMEFTTPEPPPEEFYPHVVTDLQLCYSDDGPFDVYLGYGAWQMVDWYPSWVVDWGDGTPPEQYVDLNPEELPAHTYATTGIRTVTIYTLDSPDHAAVGTVTIDITGTGTADDPCEVGVIVGTSSTTDPPTPEPTPDPPPDQPDPEPEYSYELILCQAPGPVDGSVQVSVQNGPELAELITYWKWWEIDWDDDSPVNCQRIDEFVTHTYPDDQGTAHITMTACPDPGRKQVGAPDCGGSLDLDITGEGCEDLYVSADEDFDPTGRWPILPPTHTSHCHPWPHKTYPWQGKTTT